MADIVFHDVMPHPLRELGRGEDTLWHGQHTFTQGGTYGIFAESGRGKTTALSLIAGIRKDYSGNLIIQDAPTSKWTDNQWSAWRAHSLSIVPQGLRLFDNLTALENIQFVASRFEGSASRDQIEAWAERLGIQSLLHKKTFILSFGQRQRIALIRALSKPYQWLLLDEPFSHLDKANQAMVWELVLDDIQSKQAGLIITSLDADNKLIELTIKKV